MTVLASTYTYAATVEIAHLTAERWFPVGIQQCYVHQEMDNATYTRYKNIENVML